MAADLTNADFETASGTGAEGWCDDYGLGYQQALQTPAKYNKTAYMRVPETTPVGQRTAAAYQGVELTPIQSQPRNVFVGAMVKGSGIVADVAGGGAFLDILFQVDCAAAPGFCSYAPGGTPWYPDGKVWCSTARNVGTFDWRWIGVDSHSCGVGYLEEATGHWVTVPIKSVEVTALLHDATGSAWFDLAQLRQYDAGPAAVTFMFDDGLKSVLNAAQPILGGYGYVGSAAVISSEVGNYRSLTAENLQALQAAGWDVESHSIDHPSMPTLSVAAATTQFLNSKSTLESYGLTIDSFIWPYGDYNQEVIGLAQTLGNPAPLYKSTRTVEVGDNAYGSNPYLLKVLEIDRPTTLDQVKSWINELKDDPTCTTACTGRWGIFLLHDITTTPGEYDTTPDFLQAVADEVKKSGLDVVNYRTGYQRFANVPMP